MAFSPHGRLILSGSMDKDLRRLEWMRPGNPIGSSFVGHTGPVNSVACSPDGRFALSGGRDDKVLRLWVVANRRCFCSFEGQSVEAISVAFSPEGRYALSGGLDGKVRLWEVSSRTGQPPFEGHTAPVTSVAFSPDGCFVLSGSEDKSLRLWELDWELEQNQLADWHDAATPYLEHFLYLHTQYALTPRYRHAPAAEEITLALTRHGQPRWTDKDFQQLLERLGGAGLGWLRPEGVRRELEKMATAWQGPPP